MDSRVVQPLHASERHRPGCHLRLWWWGPRGSPMYVTSPLWLHKALASTCLGQVTNIFCGSCHMKTRVPKTNLVGGILFALDGELPAFGKICYFMDLQPALTVNPYSCTCCELTDGAPGPLQIHVHIQQVRDPRFSEFKEMSKIRWQCTG